MSLPNYCKCTHHHEKQNRRWPVERIEIRDICSFPGCGCCSFEPMPEKDRVRVSASDRRLMLDLARIARQALAFEPHWVCRGQAPPLGNGGCGAFNHHSVKVCVCGREQNRRAPTAYGPSIPVLRVPSPPFVNHIDIQAARAKHTRWYDQKPPFARLSMVNGRVQRLRGGRRKIVRTR